MHYDDACQAACDSITQLDSRLGDKYGPDVTLDVDETEQTPPAGMESSVILHVRRVPGDSGYAVSLALAERLRATADALERRAWALRRKPEAKIFS